MISCQCRVQVQKCPPLHFGESQRLVPWSRDRVGLLIGIDQLPAPRSHYGFRLLIHLEPCPSVAPQTNILRRRQRVVGEVTAVGRVAHHA